MANILRKKGEKRDVKQILNVEYKFHLFKSIL